ncbi:hypothetical protein ABE426_06595 [Sphingobacterium faecium]|uniref:hypothetical protein n=1 Tax=Sphingobacterium faecium TaxID=34087 RepID=UPI00320B15DB
MKRILYLLLLVLLSSCTTNYYAMYMVEDAPIMTSSSEGSTVRTVVPQGTQVYVSPRGKSKYSKVKWKKYKGWVPATSYAISNPKGKSNSYSQTTNSTSQYKSTPSSSSGGSVQVKGYYRKNGTYVKPHTRSAPRRR